MKTKHHSHMILTNKFQFLKPDGSTIQSKTNAFYSLGYTSHKSNPSSVPQGYTGGGNMCEGLLLLRVTCHMLANRDLVYPSQSGSYRAEGCISLG